MWAPSCTHGQVCERSLPHTQTSRSRKGKYATMAERGKVGAVLIGARVTGAASPGFDMQIGRPVSRGHTRGSPYRSRLWACEYLGSSDVDAHVDAEQASWEWHRSGEAS